MRAWVRARRDDDGTRGHSHLQHHAGSILDRDGRLPPLRTMSLPDALEDELLNIGLRGHLGRDGLSHSGVGHAMKGPMVHRVSVVGREPDVRRRNGDGSSRTMKMKASWGRGETTESGDRSRQAIHGPPICRPHGLE